MTPIENQGQCGSCWAFAAVGLIEGGIKIKNGSTYALSQQQVVDCCISYLTSVCSYNGGCNGGNSEQALRYVAQTGLENSTAYPYHAVTGTCKNNGTKYKVVSTTTPVTYYTTYSVSALQTALNSKPVGIYVDASNWGSYGSGIFTGCNPSISIDHAVVAVGYDTSGNWKIRNSWGAGWGVAGFITLSARIPTTNPCGILVWPFSTTII